MKNKTLGHLVTIALIIILIPLAYILVPFCLKDMSFTHRDEIILTAIENAGNHSRIAAPFASRNSALQFLNANPDCCRILPRNDPFYSSGLLDRILGRQIRVVHVTMFSDIMNQDYELYLWIDRCGNVVDYAGTEA